MAQSEEWKITQRYIIFKKNGKKQSKKIAHFLNWLKFAPVR